MDDHFYIADKRSFVSRGVELHRISCEFKIRTFYRGPFFRTEHVSFEIENRSGHLDFEIGFSSAV